MKRVILPKTPFGAHRDGNLSAYLGAYEDARVTSMGLNAVVARQPSKNLTND